LKFLKSQIDFPVTTQSLTNLKNAKLEFVAAAQSQLRTPGLTIWDSFYPIAESSMRDCLNAPENVTEVPHPSLKFSQSWRCTDWLHTNEGATVIAVQMVVNHICNEHMPREGYCCE